MISGELRILVDWDGDGLFDYPADNIVSDVMGANWQLGMRRSYQDIADGSTCSITLENIDGKYNPESTTSILAGKVRPFKRIKVSWIDGAAAETILWIGWIESIQPEWRSGNVYRPVELQCMGAKFLLDETIVNLETYTNVTGDTIIAEVLQQSQIPPAASGTWRLGVAGHSELGATTYLGAVSDYSDLDVGNTVFPYYGDMQEPTAYKIIQEVTVAERGRFYISRDGKAIWWNRQHLLIDTENDYEIQSSGGGLYAPTSMVYVYGEDMANVVRVRCNPRNTGNSATLWEHDGSTITVQPSSSLEIQAVLKRDTGQPVASGTITPTVDWTSGTASVAVDERGGVCIVTLTNASTTVVAVLNTLTLAGAPTVNQNQTDIVEKDATNLAIYGRRELSVDLGPIGDVSEAQSIALFELARRKDPVGVIKQITWRNNMNGVDDAHMIQWTIGDRVGIDASAYDHDADYFIIGEKHSFEPSTEGGIHNATYYLEPAARNAFWILGAAGYSELGSTTRLGY